MKRKHPPSRAKSGSYLLEVEVDRLTQGTVASVPLAQIKVLVSDHLLPVCAWCQQLRDAQGEWHQLERVQLDWNNCLISHTICPTCAAKLAQ
jgi:hypothetical protein